MNIFTVSFFFFNLTCGLLQQGCAASGSLSKEDAAFVCVEALECVPQSGFIFEVVNGENNVSDWKKCLSDLMEKANQKLQ